MNKVKPFSSPVLFALRKAFTPQGYLLFEVYGNLPSIVNGIDSIPEGETLVSLFKAGFTKITRVRSPVDGQTLSPSIVTKVIETKSLVMPLIHQLGQNMDNSALIHRINNLIVPLLAEIAKDKEVFLSYQSVGSDRWGIFKKMSPQQEYMDRLSTTDPESFHILKTYGKSLSDIDETIKTKIQESGQISHRAKILGRIVNLAEDPATGEKRVYDRDGQVLTPDEFVTKRKAYLEQMEKLNNAPKRINSRPEDLRKVSDEEVDALPGDVAWEALTDSKSKQNPTTRIFATKKKTIQIQTAEGVREESVKVIASGRYKGVYLDDMVNSQGRLIEGSCYSFDPKAPKGTALIPQRIDPASREPYVTVAEVTVTEEGETTQEKKLFVKIPGTHFYSEARNALKALSCNLGKKGCIPSVSYMSVTGSNAASFYFEPKDFDAVKNALKGMSLSSEALSLMRNYFKELASAEQATQKENLKNYSAEALGGMKEGLLTKAKQALAWTDANNNKGICAMDTGMGKSRFAVALMQKFIRDGYTESDNNYDHPKFGNIKTNGRFLIVVPVGLKGNIPKEMIKVLHEPDLLISKTDTLTYPEFASAVKSRKIPATLVKDPYWKNQEFGVWNPESYVAIIFDEAHELVKNPSSSLFQVANTLHHPHKILMTASPMQKEPINAYLLASITNNIPLSGDSPEVENNLKKMRRFMNRYVERVGGRAVSVKDDPAIKRELDIWTKRNIFYADKTDVEEYTLPSLTQDTIAVTMNSDHESIYRDTASLFGKMLKGITEKFEGMKTPEARNPEVEDLFTKEFAPLLGLLNDLSSNPRQAARTLRSLLVEKVMPNGKPIPTLVQPLLKKINISQLDSLEKNPKIQVASDIILQKLADSEGNSRTLLFSDDKNLCVDTAQQLSESLPGKHVVGLSDRILVFEGGQQLVQVKINIPALEMGSKGTAVHPLPFKKKVYQRYPDLPNNKYNRKYRADQWHQFALKEILVPDPSVNTMTLLGKIYSHGHNLQEFNTVIHLDRNTWNNENMKQRTARSWRQGQNSPVHEITLDMVYDSSRGKSDPTLDEVRKSYQKMEQQLFDKIIREAQKINLGEEWREIRFRDASNTRLSRKMLDLITSPYLTRSEAPGGKE